jgi:hypothetical protein
MYDARIVDLAMPFFLWVALSRYPTMTSASSPTHDFPMRFPRVTSLFLSYLIQYPPSYSRRPPEKTLQQLRKEQRRKIEEFKKQTKFYETQNLLAKFDDAHGSPRRGGTPGPTPGGTPGAPAPVAPNAANTPVRSPARPVVQTTPSGRQLPAHLAGPSILLCAGWCSA